MLVAASRLREEGCCCRLTAGQNSHETASLQLRRHGHQEGKPFTMSEKQSAEDATFDAMEVEQDREYEAAGDTDTLGDAVDPTVLAVDSENAGLDDTDPTATSLI